MKNDYIVVVEDEAVLKSSSLFSLSKRFRGSITVFASLCMMIILSVIFLLIQSVSINASKVIIDESNITSIKSILSKYNVEIFENYHIFLLDGGNGKNQFNESDMQADFEQYMLLNEDKDTDNKKADFLGIISKEDKELKYTFITDNEGMLFKEQIVKYMKYKYGKDIVDNYLEKYVPFTSANSFADVIKEQQEVAVAANNISCKMLELMGLIDGVKVKEGTLVYDKDGYLEFEDKYFKLIIYDNSSMEGMGMSNEDMYLYRNYHSKALNKELDTIRSYYEKWDKAIRNDDKHKRDLFKKKCKKKTEEFEQFVDDAIDSGEDAVDVIDDILEEYSDYEHKKEEFEDYLNEHRDELPEDLYDSLKEDSYDKSSIENLPRIKKLVNRNLKKLRKIKKLCKFSVSGDTEKIAQSMEICEGIQKISNGYNVNEIQFDYSGIDLEKEPSSTLRSLATIFREKTLEIVTDEEKLHEGTYTQTEYPSSGLVNRKSKSIQNVIKDMVEGDVTAVVEEIGDAIDDMFSDAAAIEDIIGSSTEDIVDDILVNKYMLDNFNQYCNYVDDQGDEKEECKVIKEGLEHEIFYELEYILFGEKTDKENINEMVNRLMRIRTTLNMVSIISDSTKRNSARAIAAMLLGFTGMPIVVNFATYAIEIVWAYEEAAVDVSALLKGYYVPVMKKGNEIKIDISEIVRFNKSMVESKSKEYITLKKGIGNEPYTTYLELFLLINDDEQKLYRCMDIIQSNINNSFEVDMRFKNGIVGVESELDCLLSMKYLNMRFIPRFSAHNYSQGKYVSRAAFSY